jgi:RsiW-degrading membrane proteinase PrsW (M82 family)
MAFLVVIVAIVIVVGLLLWLGAIADAADLPPEAFTELGRTKRATITLVALTFVFGGVWYWVSMRGRLRANRGF